MKKKDEKAPKSTQDDKNIRRYCDIFSAAYDELDSRFLSLRSGEKTQVALSIMRQFFDDQIRMEYNAIADTGRVDANRRRGLF